MRLTINLLCEVSKKYRPKYEFLTRRHWKLKGSRMTFPKAYIPPEVQKALTHPPEEMLTSNRYENYIKETTVIGYDDYLNFKKPDLKELIIEKEPNYSVKRPTAYLFNQYNRFEFGEIQAALLTKSNIMKSPLNYFANPNMSALLHKNSRQILERIIMKANWWITDEDKFPKRFNPSQHLFQHKVEFGISPKNTIRYLLKSLLEYSEHLSGADKTLRMFNIDHLLETYYLWNEKRIQLIENRDVVVSGDEPLPVFQVEPVPWDPRPFLEMLGPVNPCIDLKSCNYYPEHSCDGWISNDAVYKYPHIITVNIDLPNIHTDFLEPEGRQICQSEKNAITIMNCFAQAVATARRIFGNEIVDNCKEKLPHPICIQAVSSDGILFDFVHYQLNSTNFEDMSQSNFVWIDAENQFYEKKFGKRSMLRNTRYENMKMNVFEKFLSFFQYGLTNKI